MARPLKRLKKTTGEQYIRPAAVEYQIDKALAAGMAEVIPRARISDARSPDYVTSECLVHLIREAKRAGNDNTSEQLLQILLNRCKANLEHTIRNDGVPNAAQLREVVLQEFAMLFAEDAIQADDELDYFECRFNRAFFTFRVDAYNREAGHHNKHVAATPNADSDPTTELYDTASADEADFYGASRIENALYAKQVYAFLKSLPPDERGAIVLCRLMNLTQEEAAKRMGVDARTIRNRLKRAQDKLSTIKEDV